MLSNLTGIRGRVIQTSFASSYKRKKTQSGGIISDYCSFSGTKIPKSDVRAGSIDPDAMKRFKQIDFSQLTTKDTEGAFRSRHELKKSFEGACDTPFFYGNKIAGAKYLSEFLTRMIATTKNPSVCEGFPSGTTDNEKFAYMLDYVGAALFGLADCLGSKNANYFDFDINEKEDVHNFGIRKHPNPYYNPQLSKLAEHRRQAVGKILDKRDNSIKLWSETVNRNVPNSSKYEQDFVNRKGLEELGQEFLDKMERGEFIAKDKD